VVWCGGDDPDYQPAYPIITAGIQKTIEQGVNEGSITPQEKQEWDEMLNKFDEMQKKMCPMCAAIRDYELKQSNNYNHQARKDSKGEVENEDEVMKESKYEEKSNEVEVNVNEDEHKRLVRAKVAEIRKDMRFHLTTTSHPKWQGFWTADLPSYTSQPKAVVNYNPKHRQEGLDDYYMLWNGNKPRPKARIDSNRVPHNTARYAY
jgi:hypothetical protein